MSDYDAIVIGGGLGGLTAGALLAKRGKRVLLLEQHIIPGGCATCFNRGPFRLEVGLHEMDGLDYPGDPKRRLFDELGIDDLTFVRVPEFYRYIDPDDGSSFVLPDDGAEASAALIETFPHEAKGITRFFSTIDGIAREVDRLPRTTLMKILLFPFMPFLARRVICNERRTVGQLLDACVTDERLRAILMANIAYYHDDPYETSLLYYGVAQGSYFRGGGHFVKGGSQVLSDRLAKVITDHGGVVKLRHKGTKIVTAHGNVTAVRFATVGKRGVGDEEEATAPVVVANAAIPLVAHDLLDNTPSNATTRLDGLTVGPSLSTIYLGFDADLARFGNRSYSTMVAPKGGGSISHWKERDREDDEGLRRGFAFIDYGRIDSGLAPPGKSVGAICVGDDYARWVDLSPTVYAEKKARLQSNLLARLEELLPGVESVTAVAETGTPLTVARYTLNPQGAIYGYAQTPAQAGRFRLGAKSDLAKGLYYASAWAMPGGGFTGAMMGGIFAAEAIARR